MELQDYINENFPPARKQKSGNKAAFGRSFVSLKSGKPRRGSEIGRILQDPDQWRVVTDDDGVDKLMQIRAVRLELV